MSPTAHQEDARKAALNRLRKDRKETIARVAATVKEQNKVIQALSRALEEGAKTVPELAEGTGLPPSRVLWTIAALKKYGKVIEGKKDGDYFRYRLAEPSTDKGKIDQDSPEGEDA